MNSIHILDLSIILCSLIFLIGFAIVMGKRNKTADDYFVGNKSIPWWAICGSIVATETSTLTFIGVPAISYFGNLNFVQLLFGYIIGRFIVSKFFLPLYFEGQLKTTYEVFKSDASVQKSTSVLFLITRLLGDGVRLWATAIPLQLLTGWPIEISIILIMGVTIVFTMIGGITTIIWTDFIQLLIYIVGAIIALIFIVTSLNNGFQDLSLVSSDKFQIFNFNFDFKTAYTFYWAIIGGILLTLSSHGTDQLIVQRVLSAKNLAEGQKSMVVSGFVVFFQMLFFLLIGLLLFVFFEQKEVTISSTNANDVFPYFIVNYLPIGITGLIIASIFSAAISTLSSSLSSMASSTLFDFKQENTIKMAKILTVIWGGMLILSAFVFMQFEGSNVVALGLSIASILYGGILGTFISSKLGYLNKSKITLLALFSAIGVNFSIWLYQLLSGNAVLGWTLFIPIGLSISLVINKLFNTEE